jgi:hypothetical protein
VAQTSGQQINPYEFYKQRIKDDQTIPQFHDSSSPAEILPACQRRLLWMALVFNLVSPRVFTSETIKDFEAYFLQYILRFVDSTNIQTHLYRPGNKQMMDCLSKTKQLFSLAKRALEGTRISFNDKVNFYNAFNACVECIEMSLKYWDNLKELHYEQIREKIYIQRQELSNCRNLLNDTYTAIRYNSYTDIDVRSIEYHERVLREDIILSILTHPPDKVSTYIAEKDEVIKHLRLAKIHLNLVWEEYNPVPRKRTPKQWERLSGWVRICENCLLNAIYCW